MRIIKRSTAAALCVAAAATAAAAGCGSSDGKDGGTASGGPTVFLSSQASELTEAQGMRDEVLADASPSVKFIPVSDDPTLSTRLTAESKSGDGAVDLVGALHGGFVAMQAKGLLTDVSDVASQLRSAGIPSSLWDLGKVGTDTQWYVPWTQATYVMVANKQALPYLPAGADVNSLTYDQLLAWAKNLKDRTGQPKLGLPASNDGLIKRFLEGYVLPAYTGGVVTTFKSPEAVTAWTYLQDLWQYATPQSQTYDFMADSLRSGEVWLAWDHVARIQEALDASPDDYVVFPAPSGPHGRAFMPVVAGLGVPKTAPHPDQAKALITYLLKGDVQQTTLTATGYFPVVGGDVGANISPALRLELDANRAQIEAPDALQSLLPVGLGDSLDTFDKVYTDAFRDIVLNGKDPSTVLDASAGTLQDIMNKANAPCWHPDPPSTGACQVK